MKEKNRQRRLRLAAEAKKKPAVFTVYIILRLIVVAILVSSILRGEYENAAICLLVLFLFLLPLFVQKNFGIELPVLWEFFEFGMDRLFHMDMQKDTIISSITSVMLDPTNRNIPITIDNITSVAVNGQDLGFNGYLDIGLYDTMEDLFVNFIGALTFSVFGYFYIKHRGKGRIAKAFIPTITKNKKESDHAQSSEQAVEDRDS